jgi:RNA-directed DNA polymerase
VTLTKTSIGLQELQKRIGEKAKAEPRHRFWGLYTHVWKLDVLEEAYRLAKKNNGAPGIDGKTFAALEAEGVEELLNSLSEELRDKTYRPLPCRKVTIPKTGGRRGLKIPAIRDRIVQGALRLILGPIFESDFQPGSYAYRPNRQAHQALERVRQGLNRKLHKVINLDIASYFDSVRHDLLLYKLAKRIKDPNILWLSKRILKASGRRGLPQGSVIGPLWSNVFLNDLDRMLEKAQKVTKDGKYERVRYTRFADDLLVLISIHPRAKDWAPLVERRLREELAKLELTINEDKSQVSDFSTGKPFSFLGYTFRWVTSKGGRKWTLARPQKEKRTRFLRGLRYALGKCLHIPVEEVVQRIVNPRVRGWVNYFRWGNSSEDLIYVRWQVEVKLRRFASRQRPKRKGGRPWTTWSGREIYEGWSLYNDYHVLPS